MWPQTRTYTTPWDTIAKIAQHRPNGFFFSDIELWWGQVSPRIGDGTNERRKRAGGNLEIDGRSNIATLLQQCSNNHTPSMKISAKDVIER